jgi:phosphonate transport system substrate-binding protein
VSRKKQFIAALVVIFTLATIAIFAGLLRNASPPDNLVFKVGVLPNAEEEELEHRHSPLLAYLSRETGWEFELVLADSYESLLELFRTHEVNLAYFGGFTFIQANALYGASPLVMRDIDSRATTYVVVKADGPLKDCFNLACSGLAQARAFFGPKLSTSGYLMPRYFLMTEKGLAPEKAFGEVHYSLGHRATARHVLDGEADIGIINAATFRRMLRSGELKSGDLQIVWETPPYSNAVWAVQEELDERIKTKLRDAFLALDINNAEHMRIFSLQGARSYLPVGLSDFAPLMKSAESLGLLKPEQP